MHTIKVIFEIGKKVDLEKATYLVNTLLGAMRMNGQILGDQFLIANTKGGLEVYVNTPDKDSLSKKYHNKYVKKHLSEISELKVNEPNIIVLGEEPDSLHLCDCKKQQDYILFTTYISLESSLRCYKCFGAIPLYKMPPTYHDDYYNIICWQSDYRSCDSLQMNCTVGERFAINQLSKFDSALTKQGLKVCKSIEKVTGKKVFYYLYKYSARSHKAELERKCPSCNGDWHRKKSLHNIFDFECKKCKLLSNIAWDLR